MDLNEIRKMIAPADIAAGERAAARWDMIAKPIGGLGLLEEQVIRMARLFGGDIDISKRAAVVFCADNGVAAQGVSQTGSGVTAIVARNIAEGNATVCRMARVAGADVFPVDIGMNTHPAAENLISRPIADGTADITISPAMTAEQCLQAIEVGMDMVKSLKQKGYNLITAGEMGIGNTTTAAALACALTGLTPEKAAGRGAGLDDAGLKRKRAAIAKAVGRCSGIKESFELLRQLGGLDIAGMAGLFLGGAACRCAVVIDGLISAAAALAAVRMAPEAEKALFASHLSSEPAAAAVMRELGLSPLITAGMHLGEGAGAIAAIPLFDMALSVYYGAATFEKIGVEAYKRL